MGDRSKIEWTSATWNPIRGCSRVSEGCRHCYAEAVASRFSGEGMPYEGLASKGKWTGRVVLVPDALDLPLRWTKPRRIFVNSMSDLFHEKVEDEWIDRVFAVMALCPQHTFQILTKRPERMRAYLSTEGRAWTIEQQGWRGEFIKRPIQLASWPLPNVWPGVSVEDQPTADERIPLLLQTPAAVRSVSYEPALGPVDFAPWFPPTNCRKCGHPDRFHGESRIEGCQAGDGSHENPICGCRKIRGETTHNLGDLYAHHRLSWIIVGGESGPGARPFDLAWARQTIAQCKAAGVPVFVKQLGSAPFYSAIGDGPQFPWDVKSEWSGDGMGTARPKLRDRKGGDPAEWPEDFRVRDYPKGAAG